MRRLLTAILLPLITGLFYWLLQSSRHAVLAIFADAKWQLVVCSLACLLIANGGVSAIFARYVHRYSLGEINVPAAFAVYLASQGAKYLPGKVWGLALQAVLLRARAAVRAVVMANIQVTVLSLIATTGIGLACLALWSGGLSFGIFLLLGTFGACIAWMRLDLAERLLSVLVRLGLLIPRFELAREVSNEIERSTPSTPVPCAALVIYVTFYLLGWWMFALVSGFNDWHAVAVVAAMSLSYVVGALSLLPGGIGAREGAMVLMAPMISLGQEDMAAVALVSRAALILVDLAASVIGALCLRRTNV